ncbi:conserved hypothetical protein [Vibrio chagasii]|jgi:chromosome segregation and condensation protein ScpB|uniref:hypothetical protein n=1 Tax=Vibrio TaxID=662 RepID=UPI0001530188|nr:MULTISPECIES: hypothetical protein [Vibrio]EDK30340.1 hypothetical protein VSWAT3_17273 [Vibrionales bacterium SWAT-3]MCG9562350.1 hypothetical protein [Vibrio chagasii]MCG9567203.1 hypothetical protein [Vibrio chagasii]MCG9676488.1 hypothetical protein [Vibrio chagasii]MDA0155365.1 hypothetical protein [Vibrio sp. Makdt]
MFNSDKKKVRDLLIATRFGVSASEMKTIIGVEQSKAMKCILQLKEEGEDIHTLGEGNNPEELVLYSIGDIEP